MYTCIYQLYRSYFEKKRRTRKKEGGGAGGASPRGHILVNYKVQNVKGSISTLLYAIRNSLKNNGKIQQM